MTAPGNDMQRLQNHLSVHGPGMHAHEHLFRSSMNLLPIGMRWRLERANPPLLTVMDLATSADETLIEIDALFVAAQVLGLEPPGVPVQYRRLRALAVGIVLGASVDVLHKLTVMEPHAEPDPGRPDCAQPDEESEPTPLFGTVALLGLRYGHNA